jgi:hypothetical protein
MGAGFVKVQSIRISAQLGSSGPAYVAAVIHPKVDVSRLRYLRNEGAIILPSECAHLLIYAYNQSCQRCATKVGRENKLAHSILKNALAFEAPVAIFAVACKHRPSALSNGWQNIGIFLAALKVL